MKDLIQQATTFAESGASFTGAEVRLWVGKLTDALERLTAGDVALPEPSGSVFQSDKPRHYSDGEMLDYGNRRAAAAVMAERDALAEHSKPDCDECGEWSFAKRVAKEQALVDATMKEQNP